MADSMSMHNPDAPLSDPYPKTRRAMTRFRRGAPATTRHEEETTGKMDSPPDSAPAPLSSKLQWRSAYIQVFIVSIVCFCCPGMYNSVTSMGGGIADQNVLANSAAAVYAVFVLSSLLAPTVCAAIGPRSTLFLGTLGYTVYVFCLLAYQHLGASGSLVVAGGAINGLSAGLLWTAQSQMVMAYPCPATKGWFLGMFWMVFNLGAVFGGAVTAFTNWQNVAVEASVSTYTAFILVMICGSLLTFVLANPASVIRPDGSLVQAADEASSDGSTPQKWNAGRYKAELGAMVSSAKEPLVAWILPLALYSNWFYTYQFSCFNHELFTIRSQGVNNSFYWVAQMVGAWTLGLYLDSGAGSSSVHTRARRSMVVTASLVLGTWVAAAVLIGSPSSSAKLDIVSGGADYAKGLAIYLLWGLGDSLLMVWMLWVLGQNTCNLQVLARYSGLVKGVQSLGSAISWKLNSDGVGLSHGAQFNINIVLAAVGVVAALVSIEHLGAPMSSSCPDKRYMSDLDCPDDGNETRRLL